MSKTTIEAKFQKDLAERLDEGFPKGDGSRGRALVLNAFANIYLKEALTTQKEEVVKALRKYQEAKEIEKDGKRYLVVDREKKPFGYPYPDTREKYFIQDVLTPPQD